MKNIIKLKFWAFLVFLFCFVITASAIPKLINLEGKLTNSEGIPLYGNFNMTFRIYNATSGGTLLWEEKHEGLNNVTTSNTGIFSVLLGSITELNLNFTEDYWLEIQVKDEVLSPRQRVASSGYTYMTSRLECSSMFCINYNNGNVGIGTTGPVYKLHVNAGSGPWSARFQTDYGYIDFGPAYSNGAHINTNLPRFLFYKDIVLVGNPSVLSAYSTNDLYLSTNNGLNTRMTILANNGNVGIGTTAPAYKLDVAGDIRSTGTVRTNTVTPDSESGISASGSNLLTMTPYVDNALGFRTPFKVEKWDGSAWVDITTVATWGYLTDGKPSTSLALINYNYTPDNSRIRLSYEFGINWITPAQQLVLYLHHTPTINYLKVEQANDSAFITNVETLKEITSSFYCGDCTRIIPTSTFWRRYLRITIEVSRPSGGSHNLYMREMSYYSPAYWANSRLLSSMIPMDWDYGKNVFFTGNVSIGTISPTTKLRVNGSLRVDDSTGSAILFVNDNSGRVGIGTTGPAGKLTINAGDIIFTHGTNYGTWRYGAKLSTLDRLKGRQINNNTDFLEGTSGYGVYDNGGSGSITLSLLTDDTAPNTAGRVLKIDHANIGSPSPGWGGFYKAFGRCSGTSVGQCYREGNRIVYRIWAKIPQGYTLNFGSNAYGTGGNYQWLSSRDGTGNWEEYVAVQTIGSGGTFSTTGYWYITGGTRPFTWYVASVDIIDIDQPADVDRASELNVGYKKDVVLGSGSLLTTGASYLAVDGGNVGIGTTSPTEKLVVDGNLSITNGGLKGATFYNVSDAQTSTTSTSYQTKVSLTLPSGGTYIIIASCEVTGDSTSSSYFPYVRLQDQTGGVTIGGELRPTVHSVGTYANAQSWVVPYTISGSRTIAIEYSASSSSYAAYIRNARIFALRVG
ncbi:MAG: hypothetical protein QXY62_00965 [Candidatus Altiarchaeota archaeon]